MYPYIVIVYDYMFIIYIYKMYKYYVRCIDMTYDSEKKTMFAK